MRWPKGFLGLVTAGWLRPRGATAAAEAFQVPSGAPGGLALPGDWQEPMAEMMPEDLPACGNKYQCNEVLLIMCIDSLHFLCSELPVKIFYYS